MNRKPLLLVLFALGAATLLSACGSSTKPAIGVSISGAPSSLEVSDPASFSATVTNDAANGGVTWTCSPSPCGTFTPAATASGASTTYLAPNTAGSVTITATSVTDSTETGTATITINAIASTASLTGTYTFFVSGEDFTNSVYGAAGSFTADGAGNITAGEEDYDAYLLQDADDPFTGTYTLGADGRGTMTITLTNNLTIGESGVQTFAIAVTSATHAVIINFDDSAVASGTLDAQTLSASDTSVLSGGYSFIFNGADAIADLYQTGGGVLSADGAGNLAGETVDYDDGGGFFTDTPTGETYSAPDANGRGNITIDGSYMAYYVVSGEVARFVEIDGSYIENGSLYSQGSGNVFSDASLTGTFTFGEESLDYDLGPAALAGQFTGDGAGNLTVGVADVNDNSGFPELADSLVGGTYIIANTGGGRGTLAIPAIGDDLDFAAYQVYFVDPALNILDPNNASGGGGALLLDVDPEVDGIGEILPQADPSTVAFQGNYAFNVDYYLDNSYSGQFLSDGVSAFTGTLDGFPGDAADTAVPLTGTWALDATNAGRATSSATIAYTVPVTLTFTDYLASSNVQFIVDMDAT
ncbi:MAG: hypothetical protein WAM08_12460, partial [Candidatus Acidiferrales bacterium]